ncbi:hypothetical protein CAC42_1439 [Sphaceloma murrayae]|uniref:Uncharacterized protein n=1 Tax=Sphaceloma murrayae TaxID=2082308 RepID=A0A2K1QFN8_9PEZI|nr:hypothetical protein CAC42_1439 [Sphaceloma murrayae]
MYSKFWPKGGLPGVLHHYTETLVTFEFTGAATPKPHSLLFVGGLGDGLATTSYLADLERTLEPTPWSLFTLNLMSSYQAWGLGHLDRDTDEIAKCLSYIKDYKSHKFGAGKVVLMGHSTGSQNVLHYLYRPNPHSSFAPYDPTLKHVTRPVLDGAIMQAPVSDRHCMQLVMEEGWAGKSPKETKAIFDQVMALAVKAEQGEAAFDDLLPISLTSQIGYPRDTPLSCRRFLSLNSPESPQTPREDDLFSSDLSDDQLRKTFGRIGKNGLLRSKFLVLYSGADQSVPSWVDKEKLMARWKQILDEERAIWDDKHSGIIPGASHALSNDDQAPCRGDLVRRVIGYLGIVDEA